MSSNRYYSAAAAEEDEDDFMSDKFLAQAASAEASKGPKSYTQRRKEALKRSEEKGYIKSRQEREKEAREEGLRRNLLIQQETERSTSNGVPSASGTAGVSGAGSGNKALEMMMKMGFKPGEALGKKQDLTPSTSKSTSAQPTPDDSEEEDENNSILSKPGIGGGKGKKRAAPVDKEPLGDFVSLDPGEEERSSDDEPPPSRPGFKAAMSNKKTQSGPRIDPLEIKMRTGMSDNSA
jgi:hypothetical protein